MTPPSNPRKQSSRVTSPSLIDHDASGRVTLAHFVHYMRRITTKDQYLLMKDQKIMFNEVSSLIAKESELLVWKDRYNKAVFTVAELR